MTGTRLQRTCSRQLEYFEMKSPSTAARYVPGYNSFSTCDSFKKIHSRSLQRRTLPTFVLQELLLYIEILPSRPNLAISSTHTAPPSFCVYIALPCIRRLVHCISTFSFRRAESYSACRFSSLLILTLGEKAWVRSAHYPFELRTNLSRSSNFIVQCMLSNSNFPKPTTPENGNGCSQTPLLRKGARPD